METLKYYLFFMFLVIINTNTIAQNKAIVDIKSKAKNAFLKIDNTNIPIYKVIKPQFSEEKANFLIAKLMPEALNKRNDKANTIIYKSGNKHFRFFKNTGTYSFDDDEIEEDIGTVSSSGEKEVTDIVAVLSPKANKVFNDLLKNESQQYNFMNHEYEYIAKGPGSENKFLKSVTFRYVRVKDNYPIIGNTNHIRITLNTLGKLSRVLIKDYDLVNYGKVKRKIKNAKLEKYLVKEVDKTYFSKKHPGENIEFTKTEVEDGFETYLAIDRINDKLLIPHTTFVTKSTLNTGKSIQGIVHLPIDAEFATNIEPEDIIEIGDKVK